MNIREGLKAIINTNNILTGGKYNIKYEDGVFWERTVACWSRLNHIPIELEILDWAIITPEPTLKELLSKLKEVKFNKDNKNYTITYFEDAVEEHWATHFYNTCHHVGVPYFEKHMAETIVDYLNRHHINFDEFTKTWEEVKKEKGRK